MIRVLILSQGYPPLDGGVATSTQRIAHQLAAEVSVMVFTFAYAPSGSVDDYVIAEQDGIISVRRIGPFYRHHNIDENELSVVRRRAYDQMERLARSWQPDVILSLYASNPGLLGTYLGASLGVPHIVSIRGNDVGRNIFSTSWLSVLSLIFRQAVHIACVNDHLMTRLKMAFPEVAAKASVVRNSVVLPQLSTMPNRGQLCTRAGWTVDQMIVVFIGTPREKKGIAVLLKAIEVAAESASVRLLVIGPELKDTERRSCGATWDRLRNAGLLYCTGQLDRATGLSIAAEADVIVMPSIEDGLANGLLEGMALGLCPVCTSVFNDVVTSGTSGIIVPIGDFAALARALALVAKEPESRRSMAVAAKRAIDDRFAPARERGEYMQLINNSLTATRAAAH